MEAREQREEPLHCFAADPLAEGEVQVSEREELQRFDGAAACDPYATGEVQVLEPPKRLEPREPSVRHLQQQKQEGRGGGGGGGGAHTHNIRAVTELRA